MKKVFLYSLITVSVWSCASTTKVSPALEKKQSERASMEVTALFLDANMEKLIGNYGKAEKLFKQVVAKDGSVDAAFFELAKLQAQDKRFSQAVINAEKALKLDKSNKYYHVLLAEIYTQQQRPEETIKVLNKAIKVFPDDQELYFELASNYIFLKQWNNAKSTYEEALNKMGKNPDVELQIVKIELELKNYRKAEERVKKLISTFPKEPQYWEVLGIIHKEFYGAEKAIETYNYLLEIDPYNGLVHFEIADLYIALGKDKKAFESVKKGFLSPNVDIDGKVNILLNYFELTQVKPQYLSDAYELCELLIKVHKADPKGYAVYGDFLLRDGKLLRARKMFKESLKFAPDKFILWNEVIVLNAQLNDTTALLKDTEKTLELFPNMPNFYLYRGIALVQINQLEEAAEIFESGRGLVVDNEPLKAQFYSNLGDVYHELGYNEKSDKSYDACLKINPDNAFVLNNYSYYLSLRKQKLELAEEMSKKANELEPNQASFLDTYGWILYQRGKYEEAKTYLDKALDVGGINSGTILEHYGDVLYQLKDVEGALVYWKKAATTTEGSEFLNRKIAERKLYE